MAANAAENSSSYRAKRFAQAAYEKQLPTRITETRYFVRKHDELDIRRVTANEQVNSMANCPACHRQAQAGNYDEDHVRIPGYARWED
jgi:hypothetical protein